MGAVTHKGLGIYGLEEGLKKRYHLCAWYHSCFVDLPAWQKAVLACDWNSGRHLHMKCLMLCLLLCPIHHQKIIEVLTTKNALFYQTFILNSSFCGGKTPCRLPVTARLYCACIFLIISHFCSEMHYFERK